MKAQTFLQLPPQLVEDSASNNGSSVAGDCFDDDFLSDAGRESPSNADSLAEDSDDEAVAVSSADMARLRAMSYDRSRDRRCDCDDDNQENQHNTNDSRDQSRTRPRTRQRPQLRIQDVDLALDMGGDHGGDGDGAYQPLVSILPRGTKPVRLVGEGAANAVFEIKLPPGSRVGAQFQGKLLRVAKAPVLGRAPTSSDYYLRQQEFFIREIQPHLGEHAVSQELVVLHKSGIVDDLNAMLRDMNHQRKPKFQGSFIGHASWGFLVEDMRPNGDDGSILIEFKPKWLLQSPSAPKGAIRCRQCALELRNYLKTPGSKSPRPERRPCPIALANPDCPQQVASPFRIAPQLSALQDDARVQAILDKIIHHKAIQKLRECQKSLDHVGPLLPPTNLDFVVAMTLRDCTCFALVPSSDDEEIKLRFGDFDFKDPEKKFNHWRGTEQDLIEGGFYTADWVVCGDTYYHPPSLCSLEWSGKPRTGDAVILLMEDNTTKHNKLSSYQKNGSPSSAKTGKTVYRHTADLAALHKGLEPFKREMAGVQSDSIYNNPLRCDPRRG
ncbi:Inositol-pentakisphosphate 2-kinase [Trichoderma simmonsii]|uniref:Inositol-pentakisphosphate 2-kinase n=1 Tax=Trichoderma simmonsii TaxID=1491479 RepID=A0A8G0LKG4_9HYPO|nr:Inositol-pentakisphosphate 2-kinase [Trichoderma simmonsii]